MYGMKVKNLYLVSLHPENKTYNRIAVNNMDDIVQELFDERKKLIER